MRHFTYHDMVEECDQQAPIIYRLTGGLGNILFGLSEAHLLYMYLRNPILLDWSHVDLSHTNGVLKDRLHLETLVSEWVLGEVILKLEKEEDGIQRNFRHIFNPQTVLPNSSLFLIDRSSKEHKREIESSKPLLIQGWNPDLKRIGASSLFRRGQFPIAARSLEIEEAELNSFEEYSAIHLRLGDYWKFEGPTSLISNVIEDFYIEKALSKYLFEKSKILIFSDSVSHAKQLLSRYEAKYNLEYVDNDSTPIQTLKLLSGANKIICSGSTFSFWASYFSNGISVFPRPFYWNEPGWEKSLLEDPHWRVIRRDRLGILIWRKFIRKKFRVYFRNILIYIKAKLRT